MCSPEINIPGYSIKTELGRGSHSSVRIAIRHSDGKPFCAKIVRKFPSSDDVECMRNEAAIISQISHPNIVVFEELIETDEYLCLIEEKCSGTTLLDFINSGFKQEETFRNIFRQLIRVIYFLHRNFIIHRDIKPDNIIVNDDCCIKLIDFGFSVKMEQNSLINTYVGSLYYAPPECLQEHPYEGAPADIWSAGVVLFAMLTGNVPWDTKAPNSKVAKDIISGQLTIPSYIPESPKSLLTNLLQVDPSARLAAAEILLHEWNIEARKNIPRRNGSSYNSFNLSQIRRERHMSADKEPNCIKLVRLENITKGKYTDTKKPNLNMIAYVRPALSSSLPKETFFINS